MSLELTEQQFRELKQEKWDYETREFLREMHEQCTHPGHALKPIKWEHSGETATAYVECSCGEVFAQEFQEIDRTAI